MLYTHTRGLALGQYFSTYNMQKTGSTLINIKQAIILTRTRPDEKEHQISIEFLFYQHFLVLQLCQDQW